MEVRRYSPRQKSWKQHLADISAELRQSYNLGKELTKRNIRGLYRGSFLGVFWSMAPSLATALLWIFMREMKVVQIEGLEIPYPVYVLAGVLQWQLFTNSINATISQVNNNRGLLVKVSIPKDALFFSAFFETLARIIPPVLLLLIVAVSFGVYPGTGLLVFPLVLIAISLLGFFVGYCIMPFAILVKDVQFALPLILQLLFYTIPVVYIAQQGTFVSDISSYNPVYLLIHLGRESITHSIGVLDLTLLGVCLIAGLLLLVIGLVMQRIALSVIVERMGS